LTSPSGLASGAVVDVELTVSGGTYETLFEAMNALFNDAEIRDICFNLNIDYEDLSGSGKSGKIRELISFCERRVGIQHLYAMVKKKRPKVEWDKIPARRKSVF
jgi:hypothetical protein